MIKQKTTHIQRAQRARRKREAAERREAFRLLCSIPLDELTPEQVHRRFYYNVREDKLFWRTVTGKLRPANDIAPIRSNNSEYDRADIIRRYMENFKAGMPVRIGDVEAAVRLMHVGSVDKRKAEEREARTLELQVRRLEREAEAARVAKDNYDKPFVFKPPRKATSNTADELMALAREIKEQN
jgi:hypothetical protein